MRTWTRAALSCALLLGALLLLQLRSQGEAVAIRKTFDAFPETIGDWRGREATIFEMDVLNVLKVSDYLMRRYTDPSGRSLWLYIGYWASQRKGAQIHSPRNCLPGGGWEPVEASFLTIPLPAPHAPITVNRYLIQKDRDMQLVLYWYQSQGKAVAREVEAKVEMVRSAMLRNRTDGALVRVSSPIYGSAAETTEHLVHYVQALYPRLGEHLPE
ncbi:MAG: EpsI family protein [Candidatus Rokubacteria bacterium]|nr:EpsI family protein [Candidatus Rokubacteria bacterium]